MADGGSHAWFGGRIFTGQRWVEALLVERGRVAAAGSDTQVRRVRGTGTDQTQLGGRLVIPGLIDPHLHWLGSVVDAAGVDLRGVRTIATIQERLTGAGHRNPGGPLLGSGWDQERLDEQRYPVRSDLDRVEPRRPVVLYRVCHHAAVVNSAALEAVGIQRSTPDPPGGRIGRDATGEPNGLLFDRAMRGLRDLSVDTFVARAAEARGFLGTLAGRGLTSVGAMSAVPREVAMAQAMTAEGPLPVRLRFHLLAEQWDGRVGTSRTDAARPQLIGLKIVLDGSLGARTAWLSEPYRDAPAESGMPLTSAESATETIRAAVERGLGVAMHAIGDRAVARALDLAEQAPPGGEPVRIEHASLLSEPLVERVVRLRPVLVVQPGFVASDTWIEDRVGPDRARWAYPFRDLLARGVPLAGSSDAPIESYDPWVGMEVACRLGRLSATQAVRLYTEGGATALHEPSLGNLEPGGHGDVVVLDAPDLERAVAAGGPVAEVWANGACIHAAFPPASP